MTTKKIYEVPTIDIVCLQVEESLMWEVGHSTSHINEAPARIPSRKLYI